jgi:hypothetical protein
MASKIEPLVVETLYGLAEDPAHENLRTLLQVNRADWSRTAGTEQRRILGVAFDTVRYDHRTRQLTARLKTESTDEPPEELSIKLSIRLFEPPRSEGNDSSLRGHRPDRLASVARLLAMAHRLDSLIADGAVANYAELAHYASVTRARISQIMNLLNLAPAIQEELLFLPSSEAVFVTERSLQRLASISDWRRQTELFDAGKRLEARVRPLAGLHAAGENGTNGPVLSIPLPR